MTDKELLKSVKRELSRQTRHALNDELSGCLSALARTEAKHWIKKNQKYLSGLVVKEAVARAKELAVKEVTRVVRTIRVESY